MQDSVDRINPFFECLELLNDEMKALWDSQSAESFQRHFSLALHISVEKLLVWKFEDLSERAGLRIPLNNVALCGGGLRQDLFKEIKNNLNMPNRELGFAPDEIVVALAAHHRIPTRLLDWTYRPLVAAYFAADIETLLNDSYVKSETGEIVIWAVERNLVTRTDLDLVRQPGQISQIGFLRAQDALFLTDRETDAKYYSLGSWQPYENELRKLITYNGVYKLTLPDSERGPLLDALEQKGISRPFLMPSFDNVANEVKRSGIDIYDLTAR